MLIDSYPLAAGGARQRHPRPDARRARRARGARHRRTRRRSAQTDRRRPATATTRPTTKGSRSRRSAPRSTPLPSGRSVRPRPTSGVDAGALRDGTIDGYEKGLRIYDINGFSYLAPYVTANVNLWPHTLALIANPDTLAGLTATQRNWLTERRVPTPRHAPPISPTTTPRCSCGCARKAPASPTPPPPTWPRCDRRSRPEYATMNRDPTTKRFIERIEALKETTDPGPGLDIPADCTGPAAVTPARGSIAPLRRRPLEWRRRWMARTGGRSPRPMRWRMGRPTTRRRRVRRRSRGLHGDDGRRALDADAPRKPTATSMTVTGPTPSTVTRSCSTGTATC